MTVREMIRQLVMYPMDSQVVDTDGSPIMYMLYHSRDDDAVRLEPKSQMDVYEELRAFFEEARDTNMSDNDAALDLKDRGFTIDDIRKYSEQAYEWAMQTDVDW